MRIQINPDEDKFLLDHLVDGSPVLPIIMQLDLVARALRAAGQGQEQEQPAGLLLRDITVGPAVRFGRPGPRDRTPPAPPDAWTATPSRTPPKLRFPREHHDDRTRHHPSWHRA